MAIERTEQLMTDVELVLAGYAAYARGDIDAAVARLDPQVEWIEPEAFPNGGRRQGPDAVAEYLRLSRERWADLTVEPTPYPRAGDIVVVVRHHGTRSDGTAADVTVADVFTVRDGRVVRMEAFADPAEAFDPDDPGPTPLH